MYLGTLSDGAVDGSLVVEKVGTAVVGEEVVAVVLAVVVLDALVVAGGAKQEHAV